MAEAKGRIRGPSQDLTAPGLSLDSESTPAVAAPVFDEAPDRSNQRPRPRQRDEGPSPEHGGSPVDRDNPVIWIDLLPVETQIVAVTVSKKKNPPAWH